MKLTNHERASAVWMKLEAHLAERIAACRSRNDGDLSEMDTAKLRGRIAALKEILALGADVPGQVQPDVDA